MKLHKFSKWEWKSCVTLVLSDSFEHWKLKIFQHSTTINPLISNKPLNNGQCWFPRVLLHLDVSKTTLLTVWSQGQVLSCPVCPVSRWTAAGCVQWPAHTWQRVSWPAAQALLKVTHGCQRRRCGCKRKDADRGSRCLTVSRDVSSPF